MEFSYRISEAEYLNASKLKVMFMLKGIRRLITIMFLIGIFGCLASVLAFSQHNKQQFATQITNFMNADFEEIAQSLLIDFGPFLIIGGIWTFVIFISVPMSMRRLYRKDPSMQGQFTVNITPELISIQSTAGTSSKTGWNIYDYWREGTGLILMVLHSGVSFPISLAGLSDAQQNELRGILAAALPKK